MHRYTGRMDARPVVGDSSISHPCGSRQIKSTGRGCSVEPRVLPQPTEDRQNLIIVSLNSASFFFFLQPLHQGLTQITRSNQLFLPQRNVSYTRDDSHQVSFVFFCDYRRFRRELSPPGCELRKTAQHLSQNQMPEILMIGR